MTPEELDAIEARTRHRRIDVVALVAEVRRLTAELAHAGRPRYSGDASVVVDAIDAAFTRGVEVTREACADLCDARAVDEGSNALQFAANAIRALKVAP